jgi:hypothetical protein
MVGYLSGLSSPSVTEISTSRHGDGVPVTSKASSYPENVEFGDGTLISPANLGLHHFDFSLEHARDSVPILSSQIEPRRILDRRLSG